MKIFLLILLVFNSSLTAFAGDHWGSQGIIGKSCADYETGATRITEYKVVCTSMGLSRKYMKTKSLVECEMVGLGFRHQAKRWVRKKTISQGPCE